MHFELLYIDGCTSWHQSLDNLRQALSTEGLDMEISLIRVKGDREAQVMKFQGSLTIRISGDDLFPDTSSEYGFSCRVYLTEDGLSGWPTVSMICERLRLMLASQTSADEG